MEAPNPTAQRHLATVLFVLTNRLMSISHRVLVADDDPAMLGTISHALAVLGFGVVRAESGAELVDQLADHGPFDLIVTDVSMPWMDGLNAIRSMRTAGLATPVIVITALEDDGIPTKVRALGPALLLRKPFELRDFETAVASLSPRSRDSQPSDDREA